jgi:hypothetical protein
MEESAVDTKCISSEEREMYAFLIEQHKKSVSEEKRQKKGADKLKQELFNLLRRQRTFRRTKSCDRKTRPGKSSIDEESQQNLMQCRSSCSRKRKADVAFDSEYEYVFGIITTGEKTTLVKVFYFALCITNLLKLLSHGLVFHSA